MNRNRTILLGIVSIAIIGGGFAIISNIRSNNNVMDISGDGIAGLKSCPVHNLPFSIEQVSAWHEGFRPHCTKEWWERVSKAKVQYPYGQPFPHYVENTKIDVVIRPYCAKCRDEFNVFVSKSQGEQAAPRNR